MSMETLIIPIQEGKDIYTAKTETGYVGCIQTKDYLCATTEKFSSALQAANAARKLRKILETPQKNQVTVQIAKKPKNNAQKSKNPVRYSKRLYTLVEVETMPLLRFREVWVILKDDQYVEDCLNYEKKRLVLLSAHRTKAKLFLCHEEAKTTMRTIQGVIGPGFRLMRFFIENKNK